MPIFRTKEAGQIVSDVFVLGFDAEYDEQFETTALSEVDFGADEVTELVEKRPALDVSSDRGGSRTSFMSSLFRAIE